MGNEVIVTQSCELPKHYVPLLIEHLGLIKNQLSERTGIPAPQATQVNAATDWWRTLPNEQRVVAREVLEALASPALIADVVALIEDRQAIPIRAVFSGMQKEDPVYLIGDAPDGRSYRVTVARDTEVLINTVLLYLNPVQPLESAEAKVALQTKELAVFCALTDLSRRMYFAYMNSHDPVPDEMRIADISHVIEDSATAKDMRWLLPSVLAFQKISRSAITGNGLTMTLESLVKIGLVKRGAGNDTWQFTSAGREIAESLNRRTSVVTVGCLGVTGTGTLGIQAGIFIRSSPLLWFIDPGLGTSTPGLIAAVSLAQAEALLIELVRPVALPGALPPTTAKAPEITPPVPISSPMTPVPPAEARGSPATCPSCRKPLTPGEKFCSACGVNIIVAKTAPVQDNSLAPAPLSCPSCGTPIVPGKKFCGKCGTRVTLSQPGIPPAVCPSCGTPFTPGKKFCGKCGNKVS